MQAFMFVLSMVPLALLSPLLLLVEALPTTEVSATVFIPAAATGTVDG